MTRTQIEDFVHLRLPMEDVKTILTGLTPDKIDRETFFSLTQALLDTSVQVPALYEDVMDCCGTGGSGLVHYNTSTTVAFVLAAGGVPVVKFGNRAITSKSGSFDFLEQLGIPPDAPLCKMEFALEKSNVAFLSAPQCYPTMGEFTALRRSLGIRTVFNFMGPLLNPVKPRYRLLGVSDAMMQPLLADYLSTEVQTTRALVVRGGETLDELTCYGKTLLYEIIGNECRQELFESEFSQPQPPQKEILTAADNIAIFNKLIQGEDRQSYYHRMVCLNAGAGFYIAGKAPSIWGGLAFAQELLSNGKVKETVQRCRRAYAD